MTCKHRNAEGELLQESPKYIDPLQESLKYIRDTMEIVEQGIDEQKSQYYEVYLDPLPNEDSKYRDRAVVLFSGKNPCKIIRNCRFEHIPVFSQCVVIIPDLICHFCGASNKIENADAVYRGHTRYARGVFDRFDFEEECTVCGKKIYVALVPCYGHHSVSL